MIPFGQSLLWAALIAGLVALAAKGFDVRTPSARAATLYRRSMIASATLLGGTFLLLCFMFLAVDVSVLYVWTYTGTWIPWEYRLAGAWTGREGSLLLWAGWTAGVVALMAIRDGRRMVDGADEEAARRWTHLIMAGLLVAFLVAVVRSGLFAPTDGFLLAGRPQGNGFNPTLVSPYILIHPPLMFLAYAMTIAPAASGIAHMITGTNKWSLIAGRVSRVNWVLYTFAMGLGGMWAYYTLGFGGYWAWDPVEVANLLPWLALTIYIHAQMMHARRGWFTGIGPLLAILPFILTVFSTVSTRSGLWVSVHAFTDPTNTFNPDAAGRLLGILDVDVSLLPYFGIILGLLLLTLALWCRRLAIDHGVMPRASRVIAAALALVGGMAWIAPALVLSLSFELGTLIGSPGLGALALLGIAVLAAAAPALVTGESAQEESNRKGWRRFIEVGPLAALSVLLLSLLLVVSLMWHFAAVNGWSEAFWDARIPYLLTPVVLALVVLMLRVRGKIEAVGFAGALLAVAIVGHFVAGLGGYAIILGVGFVVAGVDKMWALSFTGNKQVKRAHLALWLAALLDLIFWVDPPSFILGVVATAWPIHLLMIPLSVAALVGAHMVGLGRANRWPFVLAALLGGFMVAPILAGFAWLVHRRHAPRKIANVRRIRPIAVYGVHFALAILMLGYAMSTYGETRESFDIEGSDGTFTLGETYSISIVANPETGSTREFVMSLDDASTIRSGAPTSLLRWEPQTGTYMSVPGVLRLWDRDIYGYLQAVCILPLDDGACPAGGWVTANEARGFPAFGGEVTAARMTAWNLPGINLVWAGLALFVIYGIPMAALPDASVHRPQSSKPKKKSS
jgi:hypothetical protein